MVQYLVGDLYMPPQSGVPLLQLVAQLGQGGPDPHLAVVLHTLCCQFLEVGQRVIGEQRGQKAQRIQCACCHRGCVRFGASKMAAFKAPMRARSQIGTALVSR